MAPTSLTFTPVSWNLPQVVTITGVDDPDADGSQAYTTVTDPTTSADPMYAGFDAPNVLVANSDYDLTGFTITPVSGLVTSESGSSAMFTVVLSARPTADVLITVVSSDTGEGVVSPGLLVFTLDNWDIPAEVTVTGVDDGVADGTSSYTIVLGPATSADPTYNGFDPPGCQCREPGRRLHPEPGRARSCLKPTAGTVGSADHCH